MSDYLHQKGYIYPLGKLSDEENNSFYKKIKEEENFELDKDKFELEYMGKNDYLLWLTYSTYGEETGEFGSSRPCNQQEIYYHAPKFRAILGEIDTAKLKYIDFCYYNSTECTMDYYLGEEEYKPITLNEAIVHCKEVADSKCDECGKEHAQLADWLQELAAFKDKTPITPKYLCFNKFEYTGKSDNYFYVDKPRFEIILKEYRSKYEKDENGEFAIIDKDRITITCIDKDIDENKCTYELRVRSNGRDYFDGWIKKIGQLRMFLTICGLSDFVKQLKS